MTTRSKVLRGLAGGLLHEVFATILGLGAMLVLVRLLSPVEYGQAAAASGILALLAAFRGHLFVEHALQLPAHDSPDWSMYFGIAGAIQMVLAIATVLVGVALQPFESFSTIAPLVMVSALGLVLEWPAQVATVKLQRELQFERLKIISFASVVLRLTSSLLLAWLGYGAMALTIGSNVLSPLPMTLYLLMVERWKPSGRWWRPPWPESQPVMRFGAQQMSLGMVHALRSFVDSVVLTRGFGLAVFGLLNRAQALYQSTVGRVGLVFAETAYPLLPRERENVDVYAARAARFLQVSLLLSIPGAIYLAADGTAVSRLLYGPAWSAADAFLAPGALAGGAMAVASAAGYVLLGAGLMRKVAWVQATGSALAMFAVAGVLVGLDPGGYVWTMAGGQVVTAALALWWAAPLAHRDWYRDGLLPAGAAAVAGFLALLAVRQWPIESATVSVALSASSYMTAATIVTYLTAPSLRAELAQCGWLIRPKAPSGTLDSR